MTPRMGGAAVGPRGVYELMDAGWATQTVVAEFHEDAARRGHTVELLPVAEACRRHREFLDRGPCVGFDLPLCLPSPAQLDLFGETRR